MMIIARKTQTQKKAMMVRRMKMMAVGMIRISISVL